jgi:hypothetical protein
MTVRRSTVEHPFGTLKFWMGSAHFLMKTLPNVKTEMPLHVLSYNMKRVMNVLGVPGLLQAMRDYAQKWGLPFVFACAAALKSSLAAVFCARQRQPAPQRAPELFRWWPRNRSRHALPQASTEGFAIDNVGSHRRNTTVLLPLGRTRCSTWYLSARDSTTFSISRPMAIRSFGVCV